MQLTITHGKNRITLDLKEQITPESEVTDLNNMIKEEIIFLLFKEELPADTDYLFCVFDVFIDPLSKKTLKQHNISDNSELDIRIPCLKEYYLTLEQSREQRVFQLLQKEYIKKELVQSKKDYAHGLINLLQHIYNISISPDKKYGWYCVDNCNTYSFNALFYYILNPDYRSLFFSSGDYYEHPAYYDENLIMLFSSFGQLRHPRLQKIFSILITTNEMLSTAANIAYSDHDKALLFFLENNPALFNILLKEKIILEELKKILPTKIIKLIIEYNDITLILPQIYQIIPYRFFIKDDEEIQMRYLAVTTHCYLGPWILGINDKGPLTIHLGYFCSFRKEDEPLASYISILKNLSKTGVIQFDYNDKNEDLYDINTNSHISLRCSKNKNNITFRSNLGKKIGITLAINLNLFSRNTVNVLLHYLGRLKAPIEFSQAVLMIVCYRYFKRTDIAIMVFPLISAFLGNQISYLNTFYFEHSATFKVLSESKIISPTDYKVRSDTLRKYATTKFSLFKNHQPLAKQILSNIDSLEIRTESLVNYHIFSEMKKANKNIPESKILFKEKGGFMEGINKLRKS